MTMPDPKPQGVILVTEHNAEVNAGFAVLRGSNHVPSLLEEDWQKIPLNSGESHEPVMCEMREKLVAAYWKVVSAMVSNGRDDRDITPSECRAWIQTGLALAPLCGDAMDTSVDWAVAWSLVGEWARACFEQGSLPSLLALPGEASLLVLPGDGMFQAQRIVDGKCRPVILHCPVHNGGDDAVPTMASAIGIQPYFAKAARLSGISFLAPP